MFGTIIADPSWKFNDSKAGMIKTGKGASSHYDCMELPEIEAYLDATLLPGTDLPLSECIADRAHLYLWTPNAFLLDGTANLVAKRWGFAAKTIITWNKGRLTMEKSGKEWVPRIVRQIGQGSYYRNNTEHCVFAVRASAPPAVRNLPTEFLAEEPEWSVDSAFLAPRGEHSRKPDIIHEWAEKLSPGPRLELFARRKREGWLCIGNEVK